MQLAQELFEKQKRMIDKAPEGVLILVISPSKRSQPLFGWL